MAALSAGHNSRAAKGKTKTLTSTGCFVGPTQQDDLWDAFRHWGIVRDRVVVAFLAVRVRTVIEPDPIWTRRRVLSSMWLVSRG